MRPGQDSRENYKSPTVISPLPPLWWEGGGGPGGGARREGPPVVLWRVLECSLTVTEDRFRDGFSEVSAKVCVCVCVHMCVCVITAPPSQTVSY